MGTLGQPRRSPSRLPSPGHSQGPAPSPKAPIQQLGDRSSMLREIPGLGQLQSLSGEPEALRHLRTGWSPGEELSAGLRRIQTPPHAGPPVIRVEVPKASDGWQRGVAVTGCIQFLLRTGWGHTAPRGQATPINKGPPSPTPVSTRGTVLAPLPRCPSEPQCPALHSGWSQQAPARLSAGRIGGGGPWDHS